jgi:hypothetical protein
VVVDAFTSMLASQDTYAGGAGLGVFRCGLVLRGLGVDVATGVDCGVLVGGAVSSLPVFADWRSRLSPAPQPARSRPGTTTSVEKGY